MEDGDPGMALDGLRDLARRALLVRHAQQGDLDPLRREGAGRESEALGSIGGGGGNRTHVRKPSAAGVYVDSRSTLLLLAARYSDRQDHRAASLNSLAPPLRPGSEPATRI